MRCACGWARTPTSCAASSRPPRSATARARGWTPCPSTPTCARAAGPCWTSWSPAWEEFVAVLQQLQAADLGAAPFAFNYQAFGAYRWFNTLYQAGAQVLDGDTSALDSAEARDALEWTRQLYTDGLHAPSVLVRRPTFPDEIFPTGEISMIQTGDFLIPSIEAAVDGRFE